MKEELAGYETRLLAELTEVVERGPRRRLLTMPRLAVGGVALAALAVTAGLTLPVFGGASERSPNVADSSPAEAPPEQEIGIEPVGFSLSVDEVAITVTIDDITDDAGLEAALLAEGIASNVTYLPGFPRGCEWPPYVAAEPPPMAMAETEEGGMSFQLPRSAFAHGEVLLVAVYETSDGDGDGPEASGLVVGVEVAEADPGECVPID